LYLDLGQILTYNQKALQNGVAVAELFDRANVPRSLPVIERWLERI
jgi:hypothetical protein